VTRSIKILQIVVKYVMCDLICDVINTMLEAATQVK